MTYINTRPRRSPRTKPRSDDRVYCPPHLSWLRKRNCCVVDADFGPGAIGCSGKMEAHHVRHGANGGVGLKPGDDTAAPLCARHHRQYHDAGHDTFEKMYAVNLADLARQYWQASPHRRKWEQAHGRE